MEISEGTSNLLRISKAKDLTQIGPEERIMVHASMKIHYEDHAGDDSLFPCKHPRPRRMLSTRPTRKQEASPGIRSFRHSHSVIRLSSFRGERFALQKAGSYAGRFRLRGGCC